MLEMVDSDDFSVVICRSNGQLSLLVTALESLHRIDNRTRRIRNSVLWVGDNSDEATLRSLSIQALIYNSFYCLFFSDIEYCILFEMAGCN